MNREELIKKAAEAMVEHDNPGVYERGDVIADWDDYVGAARAAFAVFEEAHTPVAKCGGAQTNCRHDMHPPMHSAACPVSQAHTPTDDEREAAFKAVANARECTDGGCEEDRKIAEGFLAAGFRRTVQGEPSDDYEAGYAEGFHHGRSTPRERHTFDTDACVTRECGCEQGEPTDSQADAAQKAFHEFTFGPDDDFLTPRRMGITRQAWKVALRAAFNETGDDRG